MAVCLNYGRIDDLLRPGLKKIADGANERPIDD